VVIGQIFCPLLKFPATDGGGAAENDHWQNDLSSNSFWSIPDMSA
jgi:hypothetical protein